MADKCTRCKCGECEMKDGARDFITLLLVVLVFVALAFALLH